MGPHFLDPHTLNTPVLGGASEDWLVPGRHLGIVILHSMFGGCCPICSGVGPQASGHTSHSDHQAQAGQGYPSHPSCRPSATSSLDLVASGGQNPRAPEQRGKQTAPSVTQLVRQHSEGWGTLGPGDTFPARWGGGGSPQVPSCSVLTLIPFLFLDEGTRGWLAEPLGPCQEVEAHRPATAAPPASDTQSPGPREGWA